jgi:hypothetical protein
MIRIYEPVFLFDLHSRFVVNLIYHDLEVIIFLFLNHI